jgi:membrane-associated phospholipid phosphatase
MLNRIIFSLVACGMCHLHAWDFEDVGDIGQYVLPISAALLTLKDLDLKSSVQFGEEFSLTMGTVFVLKPLINDKRPNQGKWSFPSGHTASAFTGATFIQKKYGWKYGLPAYVAACGVGYSRVHARKHWMRDVCAGASIAIASNLLFNQPGEKMVIAPFFDGDSGGFALKMSW